MKLKVFGLFTLVSIYLSPQTGFAQKQNLKIPKKVVDTSRQNPEVILTVKDMDNLALLDSVRIVIGIQSKYTYGGIAVFENIDKDSVVVFRKPGYYGLVKKLRRGTMSVFLQKSTEAADGSIVNTGFYSRPDALFSGAAETVSGEELRSINVLNLFDALKYYVPSLVVFRNNNVGGNPNAIPEVRLRGTNTFPYSATIANNETAKFGVQLAPSSGDYIAANILSSGSPVVIMDGNQVSLQTAMDYDINRIHSVTVLKDAVATASYGMRGGNGVIVIKTLKPQRGLLNVGLVSELQIASADISSYQVLNAKEKLDLENKAGLYAGDLKPFYEQRYDQAYHKGVNTNWLEIPLRQGIGMKHSLNLSGGNDDMVYSISAAYNDKQGSMKGSYRKTTELGAYFGGRFKSFSFSNQFSYLSASAANSAYGSFDNYVKLNPYWSPYDPVTGKMQKVLEQVTLAGKVTNYLNPAYNTTLATTDAADYSRISNVTNMNLVFNEKLQLNGIIGINKQIDELNYFLPPNHTAFAEVSVDNLFTRGSYDYTSNAFLNVEGGLRLQYHNKFGQHEVYATAGQNLIQTSSESTGLIVQGFNVDRLADIAFGVGYLNKKPEVGKIVTRYASTFANFVYSYAERYQLDLSGANDLHSAIGENSNARFWAAGLSWNAQRESFMEQLSWINKLKIRGSVGLTGNQYFLSYLNRTTYNYFTNQQYIPAGNGTGIIGRGLGNYLTGYANDNLQSPQTFKQNIGLDLAVFDNRFALSLDFYKQKTSKLILPDVSALSTGFVKYAYYQNYGSISNKGLEFNAVAAIYKSTKNNLNWSLRLNGMWNKDKVTEVAPHLLALNKDNNITADQTRLQHQYLIGYSPTAIWAVRSLGIDPQTGKELFQKKDGSGTTVWDANDKIMAGDLLPALTGSFGTDATFRQFSAGIYFSYQLGAKVYNQTLTDRLENADLNYNVDRRANSDRWSQSGAPFIYKPLAINGLLNAPTYATTRMVQKDDRLQCASIMLGYTLPKMLANKINAKNIGIRCILNNAFELGGAEMERGIYYPFQRNYTFSLNANF
ncbi:SusC/RagA family TonB-linked outer membrane protein [Pedobacter sp. PLR]|uniref:SusC/RagA family TonB-linked outer membrane protein n=1 Tax=Pedobacter sp. PLR TaxID=2994465 RepID=UPI002246D0EF|nr:SusC/RagA family TonB-linked outer membrane protein [Pedobacter sp. PLR]MCX2452450.1 SusC/RagA family TonB-linked outer membrane protein [Pedobacter sp. PLR]